MASFQAHFIPNTNLSDGYPLGPVGIQSFRNEDDGSGALGQATSQPKPQPLPQQMFLPPNKCTRF